MSDLSYFHRRKLFAREQVTVSTTPIGGTSATLNNTSSFPGFKADSAIVEAITNGIIYTLDGSTPSSTNGNRLAQGSVLSIAGYNKVKNFLAIRSAGADAVIDISYYHA